MGGRGRGSGRENRALRRMSGVLLALLLGGGAFAQTPAIKADGLTEARPGAGCSRACLEKALGGFLAALAARDAGKAALAPGARYSENNVVLPFGQGLWRTIDALGEYRNIVLDDDAGQIGLFFTLTENGVPQLAFLRLKVEGERIAQAEILIQRRQASKFLNTEGLIVKPIWDQRLAAGDRPTRAQLIASVDTYFDGLSAGDGSKVPFSDACERIENGIQTAGVIRLPPPVGASPLGGPQRPLQRCRDQFNAGVTRYIQAVTPRRYAIVDEERGLVFGVFDFQHPGDVTQVTGQDGVSRPMPEAAIRPFTVPAGELFKLVEGRIVAIEAVAVTVPFGMPSPWAPAAR